MEQRPAYLGTRSDYFTHVHDLPPQLGGAPVCQSSSMTPVLFLCCHGTSEGECRVI